MGYAERWQDRVVSELQPTDWMIFNPRRDQWDGSWVQSIDNPAFKAQVEWELTAQETAHTILYYFAPGTQAPITLFELGLFCRHAGKDVIVVCPTGFWRKGNVDVVCHRYGITQYDTLTGALEALL